MNRPQPTPLNSPVDQANPPALPPSDATYHDLFESMDHGFCVVELIDDQAGKAVDYRFVDVNAVFEGQTGLTGAEGQRAPNVTQDWIDTLDIVARTGQPLRTEAFFDDSARWFAISLARLGNAAARRVAAVFDDITVTKQAQIECQQSQAQAQFLLALSDAMRALVDPLSMQLAATRLALDYFGADRAYYCEIDGQQVSVRQHAARPDLPLIPATYSLAQFPSLQAMLVAGNPVVVADATTTEAIDASISQLCERLHIGAYIQVPLLEQGQLVAKFCLTHEQPRAWTSRDIQLATETAQRTWDVTRRARTEAALRRSEAQYRSLFNSMDEGFCLIELLYDEQGQPIDWLYLEANPTFERQTGIHPVGQRVSQVVGPVEAWWFIFYHQVLLSRTPAHTENHLSAPDRWYSIQATPVEGHPHRLAVIFRDITPRKRRESKQRLLVELTDELARLVTPPAIMQAVSTRLGAQLQVSGCLFGEVDEPSGAVTVLHGWPEHNTPDRQQTFRRSDYLTQTFIATHRTGEPLVVGDTTTDERVDGEAYARLSIGALVVAPFHQRGHWTGYLAVTAAAARAWRADEVELISELTDRVFSRIERARAEEALRNSEERLRTVLEGIAEPFYVLDGQGQFVFASRSALQLWHKDANQLLGRSLLDVFPQTADSPAHEAHQRVSKTGIAERLELWSMELDRWVEIELAPTRQGGLSVAFRDIQDRKQAQQRQALLLQLSDTLRPLSNSAQIERAATQVLGQALGVSRVFLATVDPSGAGWHIQHDYADALASMAGHYPWTDFQRSRLAQWQAGQSSSTADSEVDPRLDAADRAAYRLFGTRAAIGVPLVTGGRLAALLSVNQIEPRVWTAAELALTSEVAERIWSALESAKVAEALRQSEAKYRLLFESIDEGFCLIDVLVDAHQQPYDHRFVQVNPAFERMTGLANLVGQRARHYASPVAADWQALYAEVVMSGQPLRSEQRSPGLDRTFDVYICPLAEAPGHLITVIVTDVTDRKQAELALQEAARRKDEFLAMLAHELRNPMAILDGALALLNRPDGPPQTLALDQALALMSREVAHLTRLVDDLLEVSRISRGQIELRLEPVELVVLVQQSLIAMHPTFMAHQQVLLSELSHQPLWVRGDAGRLTQIVRNLLSNAHKYTPDGGLIQVRLQAQAGQVVFSVKDTGIGLAADQQEAIFEAFVQVSSSLERPQGGLGLGLAVVNQLVGRHGGQVSAYSPGLGQGSEFTVTLAPIDPPPLVVSSPGASQAPSHPVRLLVVDDNADLVRVTALVLADQHYDVQTCLSGEEALRVVMKWPPDAVLLDLGMPGLNGYATCRRLRQLPWGQRGLIVALSGYGSEQDRQRTQAAGFDGHLLKPLVVATLNQLLVELRQPSVPPVVAPQPRAAEVTRQEAHDLRSAFSIISAAVSRLQTGPAEAERAELLAMIGRQVDQASQLVATLRA